MPITSILAQDPDNTPRRVVFWSPTGKPPKGLCGCPAPTQAEKGKLQRIFKIYWIDKGEFSPSREKFKQLADKVYEIKASSQLRLIGTYAEGRTDFVIVLCVRKKQNDLDPEDVKKALRLIGLYHTEASQPSPVSKRSKGR